MKRYAVITKIIMEVKNPVEMKKTPKSLRLHIAIFGRANVGKSSFLNLIAGQDVAITSSVPGTTTDVVEKAMELLPIGPVLFLDTAGLDDTSALSRKRIEKSKKVFDQSDLIILITEAGEWSSYEEQIISEANKRDIPFIIVINKSDLHQPAEEFITLIQEKTNLIELCPEDFITPPPLIGDFLPARGLSVLIVPIDLQAPKGRLILPQVQAIRDALDNDAATLVVKEREYSALLDNIKIKPDIVVCDSQVVMKMVAETPADIKCTTFSILFSRYKGDLIEAVKGASVIKDLGSGDKVLIAEACSHHALEDDIGRVKIPRWLKQYAGADIKIDICAGKDYPEDLSEYSLVIHCGACMFNRRQMLARIHRAKHQGVPITNYGVCISMLQGVIEKVLSPFPAALDAYKRGNK
jgi:[FeFe] hydrogenase H-cluster maturation GTPase HydF